MKILAIESSCDETAAAVIEDGRKICSNIINSQAEEHALYGGVVPEIASRWHGRCKTRLFRCIIFAVISRQICWRFRSWSRRFCVCLRPAARP